MSQGLSTILSVGTELYVYDKGTRLVALNSLGRYLDFPISGWAGGLGVVTSSTRREEDAHNFSSWEDKEASTEGCGDPSASAVSRY